MVLQNTETKDLLEAVIESVDENDFKQIRKNKIQFKWFNWTRLKTRELYKLCLKDSNIILGLMCILEHKDPATDAIEIELLEVGDENVGSKKKLDNIAGCLIAFACRESFRRGHGGWMFLTPKTELIAHYTALYGLKYVPPIGGKLVGMMLAEPQISHRLIRKYLD